MKFLRPLLCIPLLVWAGCGHRAPAPAAPSPNRSVSAAVAPAAADEIASEDAAPLADLTPETLQAFGALPQRFDSPENPITEAKVTLGRMLYFDKRLSKNQDVSCNSCHRLGDYGVDGDPTSQGHRGQKGDRNSPTVYNAGGYVAQFWDGRAKDLEDQAKGPILNPVEMAMPSPAHVEKVLRSIPGYVKAFKVAFPGDKNPVSYDNLAKAIGAFERQLVTPSRFDAFLTGKADALTEQEQRGLRRFVGLGCTSCHNGSAIGGSSFQKLGLIKPWQNAKDEGRFKVTKAEEDQFKFRVPTLRNISKTGPYLHDGTIVDLPQMVRLMADHQLGQNLKDQEVADIVAFLEALTGDIPTPYIAQPELPPSGPKTPKPDPS